MARSANPSALARLPFTQRVVLADIIEGWQRGQTLFRSSAIGRRTGLSDAAAAAGCMLLARRGYLVHDGKRAWQVIEGGEPR